MFGSQLSEALLSDTWTHSARHFSQVISFFSLGFVSYHNFAALSVPALNEDVIEHATIDEPIEPASNEDTIIEPSPKFSGDDNAEKSNIIRRHRYMTSKTPNVYCFENYSKTTRFLTPYDKVWIWQYVWHE